MSNVLIDTSVVLDGIENVTMIDKKDNVFVTDVVLRELDGNKGAEGSKGYNAREFFRQLNQNEFTVLNNLPITNQAVSQNDILTEGSISSGAHIYTLSRKWYRAKDINDSRIIEIAKDYGLKLKTLDQAQGVRAKSQGIEAEMLRAKSHTTSLKGDVFIVVSLIYFTVLSFSMMALEFAMNKSMFLSLVFASVAIYAYGKLLNKLTNTNSATLSQTVALGGLTLSIGLFLAANISENIIYGVVGFISYLAGIMTASNMNVSFKFLSLRYSDSGEVKVSNKINTCEHEERDTFSNTILASGNFGKSNTHYYL